MHQPHETEVSAQPPAIADGRSTTSPNAGETADAPAGPSYEVDETTDERLIREGIERAIAEDRSIDNRTARYIASQLHGGQASALYSLASTGNIDEAVHGELISERLVQPPIVQDWIDHLLAYCVNRLDKGPVEGWAQTAALQAAWEQAGVERRQIDALDPSLRTDDEAAARADLMRQIEAGSVMRLGDIATVTSGPTDDERDTFSWGDAARWSPEFVSVQTQPHGATDAELTLFDEEPDEQIGDVAELGWYALIRSGDGTGGLVLRVDEQGFKYVLRIASDDVLTAKWSQITHEYSQFYEERDAYELATNEQSDSASGLNPRVWVASLSDYVNGDLYGAWMNATLEPGELEAAVRFMLRNSPSRNAEEWGIFDYDDFGGHAVASELGEYPGTVMISLVAKGVAEHGAAFGEWVAYVGTQNEDAIARFSDHFIGEWDSFEAYVENFLEDTDFYRFLDYVPEDMQGYVTVDTEQIAQDWGSDYHVVEAPNGHVFIFDTRA